MDKEFYTTEEVASILAVSQHTVYRLLQQGELAAVRVKSLYRIPRQALQLFVAENSQWQVKEKEVPNGQGFFRTG